MPTFNSLANIVASCVATPAGCPAALRGGEAAQGTRRPTDVLQAVANIAKYPWVNVGHAVRAVPRERPVYAPALRPQAPDAWTLFLKFTGSFSSVQDANNFMNGPGAFAIDEEGFIWASNVL